MRNRVLDGSTDRTDLVIVFVFTRVEFMVLWLLSRRDVARGKDAILQPPKPEIRPSPQVLERAADRDADWEAAD
jgi:hypothetical protein